RKTYDEELFRKPSAVHEDKVQPPVAATETVVPAGEDQKLPDWQTKPPPLRQPREATWPAPLDVLNQEAAEDFVVPGFGTVDTAPDSPWPAESTAPSTADELLANFSRRRLRSKRALYYQVARIRQLYWAWEQAGKHLSRPGRLVS